MISISYRSIILVFLAFLSVQCEKDPEPNDPVDITDQPFLDALIEAGFDENADGLISYAEALRVNKIDLCGNGKISSLEGLEAFKNLDTLDCCGNQLKVLDVSANTELLHLVCWNRDENDQLEYLNISNNKKLKLLSVLGNQLSNLDISNNTSLQYLNVFSNQLSTLDVSHNKALKHLWIDKNQLTTLDLRGNTELLYLTCSYNHLASLDISHNQNLVSLDCSANHMLELDIRENRAIDELYIRDMPSLDKVCVWYLPFPPSLMVVDTTGSPNVIFATECSQ